MTIILLGLKLHFVFELHNECLVKIKPKRGLSLIIRLKVNIKYLTN